MEVSSMVYRSCATMYNMSPQKSFINSDKDSTSSSLIYSATSNTLQNDQNVISNNNKIMESTSSRIYSSHESTHDTLYTQNAFKDSSIVYPVDSSCTFSKGLALNTNNVMKSALSTEHNSNELIYANTQKTFMNPEKNIIMPALSNSGSSCTLSDHEQCTNSSNYYI